jgi:nucleotide-binding universal stress UspA family protein
MLPAYKTILCCHGFGTQATEVLRHAFGIAKCYDARVVIIHVLEPPNPQAQHMLDTYLPPEKFAEFREAAMQSVVTDIGVHVGEACGDACRSLLREVKVLEGRPADRVLQEAKDLGADLIVMGSHRHSTVGELLLGSTAHRVTQQSPVPVLLVRLTD